MGKDRSRRTTGKAHPVDVYVGARIKLRRAQLGLTQTMLANLLGLTFQQVQKYERASNRISSSRLFEIAHTLGVDVDYFFEGMPDLETSNVQECMEMQVEDLEGLSEFQEGSAFSKTETLRLINHYYRICPEFHRHAIFCLVENLAERK